MSSKAILLDYPISAPGKCIFCGSGTRHDGRRYVDFGLQIERYGAVYFCTFCLAEIVALYGWLGPDKTKELKQRNEEFVLTIVSLEEENERFRRALSELDFLGSNSADGSTAMETSSGSNSPFEGTDNESINTTERREETKNGSSESSDEQGLAYLFGNDSTTK